MISQRDVVAPNVKLPFSETQHAAEHVARMDADSHVDIESCGFTDKPEIIWVVLRVHSK